MEIEPAAARMIARAAQGSVRDGLSLLDQCLATGDRPVTLDTCRRALGLAHPDVVRDLLEALAGRDAAAALRAAAVAFDAGADPRQLLRECARLARAAEMVAVGFPEGARLDADEEDLCRRLATREPDGFWLRVLEEMGDTELELRQPVDARLQVEACVLRLCRGGLSGSEAERLDALELRLEDVERRGPAPARGGTGPGGPPTRAGEPPARHAHRPGASAPGTEGQRTAPHPAGDAGPPPARVAATVPDPDSWGAPGSPAPGSAAPAPASAASSGADPAGAAPSVAGGAPAAPAAPAAVAGEAADPAPGGGGTASPEALVSLDAWQRAWPALIDAVNRRDKVFAGVLRGCRPLEAGADRLVVGAPYDFHLKQLGNPAKRPVLVDAVAAVAGGPREVSVEFCGEAPAASAGAVDAGADLTDAVVATFAGSRITSTRLVDHAHDPVAES